MSHSPPDRPETRLISLDWGTTSLRAYRLGDEGEVLEVRATDDGLMQVQDGDFAGVLQRAVGDWIDASESAAIIASGMVTARTGWKETPYVRCPGNPDAIAGQLQTVAAKPNASNDRFVHLVPGMDCLRSDGLPDVMRGEETQLLGLNADAGARTVVLPGTHSKWVSMDANTVRSFQTTMTGETFAVLSEHSILRLMMHGESTEQELSSDAFLSGVETARDAGGHILARLFGARTLPLTGALPESQTADWLSGLLIAGEIAGMLAEPDGRYSNTPISLVGNAALSDRYRLAFNAFDIDADQLPARNVTATGHWRIAQAASLV